MTLKLSFGGCVFDDLDANGIVLQQDANGNYTDTEEPGLAGVTVRLVDANGSPVAFLNADGESVLSTTTDSRGFYKIFGLAEGSAYKIQFDYGSLSNAGDLTLSPPNVVEPAFIGQGGSEGKDSDAVLRLGPTTVETELVIAGSGASNKVNLGLIKPDGPADPGNALLGNQVFEDANRNGLFDRGEVGVAGVQVTLDGAGADGIFGTGDDISRTTVTRNGGVYDFRNLDAGDYKVTFDQPDGFEFTQANVGTNEGKDSDADVNTGMTDVISLVASERNFKVDAGLVRSDSGPVDPTDARLGNRVFLDANRNGRQDVGEAGVGNVQVTLADAGTDGVFGTGDDVARTTTTDQSGLYRFDSLAAGDYKVTFDQLDGFEFTQANIGSESGDSDADITTGMTDVVSLAASETNLSVDAGLVSSGPVDPQNAKLGNQVFEDANANGILDRGEAGVAGVQVTLDGAGADGVFGTGDDISEVTTTNANGTYSFRNLAAGDYKVTFDNPDGFEFTQANVGTNEGKDSDADVNTGMTDIISLAASERNFKVDAGLVRSKVDVDLAINYEATNVTATRYASPGFQYNPDIAFPYDVMRYDVTITNQSNETATGIVAKAFVPENIDLWQPGQTRSDTGYSWNQYFDFSPYVWRGGFSGHPGFVDSTNGNVDITDPGTASVGRKLRNQTYGLGEGSVVWELGDSLEAGESATLSFFGMRELRDGYDFSVGTQFFTEAAIHAVDQHDTNSANDTDSTRSWWISPLALDLDGDGVQTLSIDEGIKFDMLNTGTAVNTGWLSGGDGFLAVDNDGDGFIASRDELFGGGIGDGFAKLASYDSNGDGWVNAQDSAFSDLSIWQDANSNGITDAGELATLASHGVTDLNTSYTNVFSTDAQGNVIGEVSSARTASGDNMSLVDVYFQVGV